MGLFRTSAIVGLGVCCAAAPVKAGVLEGAVVLEGPRPAPVTIPVTSKSPDYPVESCGGPTKASERLLVGDTGGVANAVVWLEMQADDALEPSTANLDQRTCDFAPHLLLVPRGSTVQVSNSDPILHNLRLFREASMLSHAWQKPKTKPVAWQFDKPGRFLVRCGVHSWMTAWVVVADHRYYTVSNSDGTFAMPEAPPGAYTLHAWHEVLGEQRQRVSLERDKANVTIRYTQGG